MNRVLSSRSLLVAVSTSISLMLGGCGRPNAALTCVEGAVTCGGAPLTIGSVIFTPEDSNSAGEARGTIDEHGHYILTHDLHRRTTGVPAGKYRVAVLASQMVGTTPETQRHEILVPTRYTNPQTSGIVVDVPEGRRTFTVDLSLEGNGRK